MITKIKNGRIISGGKLLSGYSLYFSEDGILSVSQDRKDSQPFDLEYDANGNYVSAGFIDLHTHGGGGYDFMDGGIKPIVKAAALHLSHGTTSIFPTSLACSTEVLGEFLRDLRVVMEEKRSRCNILGAHLEGPYFSLNQSGAQNPDYIKAPDPAEYEALLSLGKGVIKRWSFAPELSGSEAFCRTLSENGIVPAIAHSDAVYEDVKRAYDCGCHLVTHLYSGMSTITRQMGYRRLGVTEAAYLLDMDVEVIADGKHLPPELLALIYKLKGRERICLVTDSMRGAGMPAGESLLGRKGEAMPCIIEDGVAKLTDRSAFAGSVATTDRLVRTFVKEVHVPVEDAVAMMTVNPARVMGLKKKGDIAPGMDADIVVFDADIQMQKIFVGGKAV